MVNSTIALNVYFLTRANTINGLKPTDKTKATCFVNRSGSRMGFIKQTNLF